MTVLSKNFVNWLWWYSMTWLLISLNEYLKTNFIITLTRLLVYWHLKVNHIPYSEPSSITLASGWYADQKTNRILQLMPPFSYTCSHNGVIFFFQVMSEDLLPSCSYITMWLRWRPFPNLRTGSEYPINNEHYTSTYMLIWQEGWW